MTNILLLVTMVSVSTELPTPPRLKPKLRPNPKPKHPTLVVPVTPRLSQIRANKHHYPVAANGKLLDIAVIAEEKPQPQSTKSPKVTLHQWYVCLKQIQTLGLRIYHVKENLVKRTEASPFCEVWKVSFCPKCSLKHDDPLDPYRMKHNGYSVPCATLLFIQPVS